MTTLSPVATVSFVPAVSPVDTVSSVKSSAVQTTGFPAVSSIESSAVPSIEPSAVQSTGFPAAHVVPFVASNFTESSVVSVPVDCFAEVSRCTLKLFAECLDLNVDVHAEFCLFFNPKTIRLNHTLHPGVQSISPFHVVIGSTSSWESEFRRQTACSMLAAMAAEEDLYPRKLDVNFNVHVLLQPHDELEAEMDEYFKLGFVQIATVSDDSIPSHTHNMLHLTMDVGAVRLSANIRDVLLKSGWMNPLSGLVYGSQQSMSSLPPPSPFPSSFSPPSPPYLIKFNIFQQEKLTKCRQHLVNAHKCINFLRSKGIQCEFKASRHLISTNVRLSVILDLLRPVFPELSINSFFIL